MIKNRNKQLDDGVIQLGFPALIITPSKFEEDQNYALLYLLHGYSLNYQQWRAIVSLQSVADKHNMIIVCPEGERTFFMNSNLDKGIKYEKFFFEKLVPYIHSQYPIAEDKVFISGASMGGFGALHLMLKRPDYFTASASSSGTASFDYHFWKKISYNVFGSDMIIQDLEQILGPWPQAKETWHNHSLVNRIDEFEAVNEPMIIDCGRDDPVYTMNEQLMDSLRNVENVSTEKLPGAHSSIYWAKSINLHLNFFSSLQN